MSPRAERADRPRDWLAWLGAALGVGLLAFTAGALGILGRPPAPPAIVDVAGSVLRGAPTLDCPGGSAIGLLRPDTIVFATARSEDGDWLALRDPANNYETVWVARAELVFGDPLTDLPVDGCVAPTGKDGKP